MHVARAGTLAALAMSAWAAAACVLPAGAPCCAADGDCDAGLACFEGRCTARCEEDAQCDEGERCLEDGLCAALRGDDACVTRSGPPEAA